MPDTSDNRWREFDVRVNRPGVNVLHRKGYMALAPVKQPVNGSQSEWQALITQGNPQQTVKPSIVRFAKTWTISPDTRHIRLIVRDRTTGRFGALDMPLSEIRRGQ